MLKVVKFGGSSLADANQFRKVADIIRSEPCRRYVVASAPGKRSKDDEKVTDMLFACYNRVKDGEGVNDVFEKIEQRYQGIIDELGLHIDMQPDFDNIKSAILSYAGRDYVASRGEYLNSKILAAYLGFDFIDAEKGIYFDESGRLDADRTDAVLSAILSEHEYAVVPGFYGSMPNGTIKTFSRGGSDITGSIVARAANADIYENWTDVSGMLMVDPRCVSDPEPIDFITYRELRELSYMGATVMHEEAIFPVRVSGIPINIRNTNDPSAPGTMIVPQTDRPAKHTITGIAGKKGFSAISIEKDMLKAREGFCRKTLEVLEDNDIRFEHIPSGIDTMTFVVPTAQIADKKDAVTSAIIKTVAPDIITINDELALIAVVGRGMVRTQGTAVKVFKALADRDINVRMIDQGSSEINIIVGIDEKDYENALDAIYREFVK